MNIFPIHTAILKAGDDLASILRDSAVIEAGDIVVVSSKAVATTEGAAIDLSTIVPTDDANMWAQKTGKSAAFCQAVLQETARLHGKVMGAVHGAMLTEIQTDATSTILVPNAGLDESNVVTGYAIGWPVDPVHSAKKIRDALNVPIIIGDSCVYPRRRGVMAFALTACGIDPIRSEIGKPDLFGHPLQITQEAVADQLTIAANAAMGNANQGNPAALIRDHGIAFSDFCGWVPAMDAKEDLFNGFI